ncbi:MAG: hypothetical protein R3B72_37790 [Polyangiaceae bacterium]
MNQHDTDGRKLLAAVERLVAHDGIIEAEVTHALAREKGDSRRAAEWLVRRYAGASGLAGGAAASPSLLPGWGALAAVGTAAAEMVWLLKTEVEMCLALVRVFGMRLDNEAHRKVAFLLAATVTHEAATGRPLVVDLGEAGIEAIWSYSPREVSKLVVGLFAHVGVAMAARQLGISATRILPVVAVGVGAGMNFALTRRAGRLAISALEAREVGVRRP